MRLIGMRVMPFCNVLRLGLDALAEHFLGLSIERWCSAFYGSMSVFMVSPWGLDGPYPISHGGAQGDSMGVGAFSVASVVRTRFKRGVLNHGLSPSALQLGLSPPPPSSLSSPECIHEVVWIDDRSLFGLSREGPDRIVEANCQSSWSGGGTPQSLKLKGFQLCCSPAGPRYQSDDWNSFLGRSSFSTSGFVMTGVPLVMGDAAQDPLHRLTRALQALHRSVLRYKPMFLLTLRLLLVYVLSTIDSVFEAMPPVEAWLSSAQTLVHRVAPTSPGIRQHLPRAVLYGAPQTLGFCVPLLFLRSKLRYLKGPFKGINSRSILTRETARHVLHMTREKVSPRLGLEVEATKNICGLEAPQEGLKKNRSTITYHVHGEFLLQGEVKENRQPPKGGAVEQST